MPRAGTPTLPDAERRPRASARWMLFNVLGECVYPEGIPVWTSAFLRVLEGLGFTEEAARQAIARGASAGWISGERRGRETQWALTELALSLFDAGGERVFGIDDEPRWDGRWLVLAVTIPHARRGVRKRLYTRLSWAGLGNPSPGLWVTPHSERAGEIARALAELELEDQAMTVIGELGSVGLNPEDVVRRAWDLDAVAVSYAELLKRFTALDPAPGDETLHALLQLSDEIRRLPLMDPHLPAELSPDWIGREATQQLKALREQWVGPALSRWREIAAGDA